MGLFSFKRTKPASITIPPDILADVSVNGVKKGVAKESKAPVNLPVEPAPTSRSPFLKSQAPTKPGEPSAPTVEPKTMPAAPAPSAPQPEKATPKPFHFADQNPIVPEVSFNEPRKEGQAAKPAASQEVRPDFSQITKDQALADKAKKEVLAPLSLQKQPHATKATRKPLWSASNILAVGVFILILGLISGGSWYYLNTRSVQEEAPAVSIEQLPVTATPQQEPIKGEVMTDQPNYLNIDVETITREQIKVLLEQEAEKMKAAQVTVPAEYLVLDTNGNPVAFSRFALLVEASTPSDLVNASLEPFSLYLYLDQGALRIALAVALKAETSANFPANKTVLPQSLKKFFYPNEYQSLDLNSFVFTETTYKNNTIFYINLDEAQSFSFDMSTEEGTLTVANSKNTLRAVIDKRLVGQPLQ